MKEDHTARIRALNDRLRQCQEGGRILLTAGLVSKEPVFVLQALGAVRNFAEFSVANDPYDEHDFGAVDIDGETVFWKIDYYDPEMRAGSEDPSEEAVTMRVLTIMLAEEY